MALNQAIESIVTKLSLQFGAEDAIENEAFKSDIRTICAVELEPVFSQMVAPQQVL